MGDWESTWGMGDSGASMGTSPCWNDDWEQQLLAQGYRPVEEWNEIGHVIKKGEKGKFLPCARVFVFSESQTRYSSAYVRHREEIAKLDAERDLRLSQCASTSNLRHFNSFAAASDWAKANPGRGISRCIACSAFTNGEPNVDNTQRKRYREFDFGMP